MAFRKVNNHVRKFDVPATFACIGTLFFWSSGPIFIKFLTEHLDSWTQNMLRYLAACLFWLPFLLFLIKKKLVEKSVWRRALLPVVPNLAFQSLWAVGFYYIDPTFMVLLNKSSIIWIAGFSLVFFVDERPLIKSNRFWTGMFLSVVGVIGVLLFKKDFTATQTITGVIIALSASVMWAIYSISVKIAFKNIDSRAGFSVISIYTVFGLCVLAFIFGRPQECLHMGSWPWACVIISGVTAIGIGHVLYYVAMKRIGATIPALVVLAQPFIVFAVSNIFFGESLDVLQWFFGVALLAGAAFAIRAQQHLRPTKNNNAVTTNL
jgi:drug/metabolite transporter (DMT)-like permease